MCSWCSAGTYQANASGTACVACGAGLVFSSFSVMCVLNLSIFSVSSSSAAALYFNFSSYNSSSLDHSFLVSSTMLYSPFSPKLEVSKLSSSGNSPGTSAESNGNSLAIGSLVTAYAVPGGLIMAGLAAVISAGLWYWFGHSTVHISSTPSGSCADFVQQGERESQTESSAEQNAAVVPEQVILPAIKDGLPSAGSHPNACESTEIRTSSFLFTLDNGASTTRLAANDTDLVVLPQMSTQSSKYESIQPSEQQGLASPTCDAVAAMLPCPSKPAPPLPPPSSRASQGAVKTDVLPLQSAVQDVPVPHPASVELFCAAGVNCCCATVACNIANEHAPPRAFTPAVLKGTLRPLPAVQATECCYSGCTVAV